MAIIIIIFELSLSFDPPDLLFPSPAVDVNIFDELLIFESNIW